jgi:hypothetical protein
VTAAVRESSITLQQIVARQEQHYKTIRSAQGVVVWQERRLSADAPLSNGPARRVIHFEFEGDRSVTLVLPWEAAQVYSANQGAVDWRNVLSAAYVHDDQVDMIRNAGTTSSTQVEVRAVPYNPAVHDNNPLVAFHPRQLGDERVPLRELAAAAGKMPTRPLVTEVTQGGKVLLRIDFTNASTPGEEIYYIIDPNRGYLPVEIGRISQGKVVSRSVIVIGNTPDKTWIPARRTTTKYDLNGRALTEESWYYDYLAVNEKLAPRTLSLLYFKMPQGTNIIPLPGAKLGAATATPVPTPTASPTPGARRYY